MWILIRVTVHMVRQMQLRIRLRVKKGRTLRNESQQVEKPFPKEAHLEHFMSRVPVQKEALRKCAEIPVYKKE